jgi:glycosyltransferase involved in cell wall biosynthesis
MNRSRRILIASYHFPPDAAVGALRAARFARMLRELGWEPFVLTVKDYRRARLDQRRMDGLQDVPIVKAGQPPSLREILLGVRSAMRRLLGRKGGVEAPVALRGPAEGGPPALETARGRLRRYFVSLVMALPDMEKNWAFWAAFRAVWMIRRNRIDYLLTSGPPASGHFVGVLATLLTRVTWAADLRDAWLETVWQRPAACRCRASDAIETAMERLVMTRADVVLTTNDWLANSLRQRYATLPREKFVSVPNSIDADRFQSAATVQKFPHLTITYAGTIYYGRTPEPLFRAVSDLIRSGDATASDIGIKLLGECKYIDGVETATIVRDYGLDGVVEVLDPVPYPEALRIMQMSHLLLMIAPENHKLCVPAKLFDYLGSGTKVLALTGKGATADMIHATASGICFSDSDVAGLRDYLHGLIQTGTFRDLQTSPESLAVYDSRRVTQFLSNTLLALRRVGDTPRAVSTSADGR